MEVNQRNDDQAFVERKPGKPDYLSRVEKTK
jgi:hypothetical protein